MVSRRVHNFVLKQIYIRHYNRISYFETVQVRHALLPSSSDCWRLECASIGACVGLGCVSLQPILGTLVRLQFTCLALETIALISAMPGMLSVSDPLSALAAHVGCHFHVSLCGVWTGPVTGDETVSTLRRRSVIGCVVSFFKNKC